MNTKLDRQEVLRILDQEYNIRGGQVYLLELIPLAEMLWIDGKNQPEEIQLVYEYALNRVAELSQYTEGERLLTKDEIDEFMQRFVHNRPPAKLLTALRKLANSIIFQSQDEDENEARKQKIIDFCIDIASSSVENYPYSRHARFDSDEKKLLNELIQTLNISFETEVV